MHDRTAYAAETELMNGCMQVLTGKSLGEIAAAVGVDRSTLTAWRTGDSRALPERWQRIAELLMLVQGEADVLLDRIAEMFPRLDIDDPR